MAKAVFALFLLALVQIGKYINSLKDTELGGFEIEVLIYT